jgi:hypothetical protein
MAGMTLGSFLAKYNSGSIELTDDLSKGEINRGGGLPSFIKDLEQLRPEDRDFVMTAIRDYGQRDQVEQAENPALNKLVKEFDKGHPTLLGILHPGKQNYHLDKQEIEANGGFAKFLAGVAKLSPQERLRLAEMVDYDVVKSQQGASVGRALPGITDLNSFGTVQPAAQCDFDHAEAVRAFLTSKLYVNPFAITAGLGASDLPRIKDNIASEPEEQFVLDLRKQLAGGRRLNILEFYGFLKATYPTTPVAQADVLAAATEADPKRFNNHAMNVVGYPTVTSTDRHFVRETKTIHDVATGKDKTVKVWVPTVDMQCNVFGTRDHTGACVATTMRYELGESYWSTQDAAPTWDGTFMAAEAATVPAFDKYTPYRFHGTLKCDANSNRLAATAIDADTGR